MTEPTTKAGRALLAQVALHRDMFDNDLMPTDPATLTTAILDIEKQAAALALADATATPSPAPSDGGLRAALADLDHIEKRMVLTGWSKTDAETDLRSIRAALAQQPVQPDSLDRQMLEAAAVRQAILDLHRERGRMSKVTESDYLIVLGGVRQLSDEALAARLSERGQSTEEEER